ncbi:MarR family winged helix-turn-helix transcriptional regulator [Halopolyspora algeriensis]|nr:MarR family winged helix-turn-helix transcriptional regulator [Halopolyspora algeriensis]
MSCAEPQSATPGRRKQRTAYTQETRVEIDVAPVGSVLLQVVRAHARLGTELLRGAGLTPPHELVLLYLDEHEPAPQPALVTYLGRDRSTVTATLQAMERADLIERSPSETDSRAMTVSLTAHGRQQVSAARAAWRELERHTTSRLTHRQLTELQDSLTRVRDTLETAHAETH